jgi:hypothetical protein
MKNIIITIARRNSLVFIYLYYYYLFIYIIIIFDTRGKTHSCYCKCLVFIHEVFENIVLKIMVIIYSNIVSIDQVWKILILSALFDSIIQV